MESVICVGSIACNVGLGLKEYKNYKISFIDDEVQKTSRNSYCFKKYETPEKYEEQYDPGIDDFLKKRVTGDSTFIVSGASLISGALLRMMQAVKKTNPTSNIQVLYVKPDTTLLSETKKLQERVVYNVLQQYARSGVFTRLLLVCSESLSTLMTDTSIIEYYDKMNELISSTFHMINVLDNTKSVVDTFSPPRPTSRIATMAVFVPGSQSEENLFFPLENKAEARYYYGIPEAGLKEEKNLYREILAEMKKRVEKFSKVSYGIYETSYDTKIGYAILYSNQVQE